MEIISLPFDSTTLEKMASDSPHLRPFNLVLASLELDEPMNKRNKQENEEDEEQEELKSWSILEICQAGTRGNPMLKRTKLQESFTAQLGKIQTLYDKALKRLDEKKVTKDQCIDPSNINGSFDRNTNPANVAALLKTALNFEKRSIISSIEATTMYLNNKYDFLSLIQKYMNWTGPEPEDTVISSDLCNFINKGENWEESLRKLTKAALRHILSHLSINTIPLPTDPNCSRIGVGSQGHDLYLVLDIKFLTDILLISEYQTLYDLKVGEKNILVSRMAVAKKTNSKEAEEDSSRLTPENLSLLKQMLPSSMTMIVEYLLCASTSDDQIRNTYGITSSKALSLRVKMARAFEEGRLIKSRLVDNPLVHEGNIVSQVRKLVFKAGVFTSKAISLGRERQQFKQKYPSEYDMVIKIL